MRDKAATIATPKRGPARVAVPGAEVLRSTTLRLLDALFRRKGIGRLHLELPTGANALIGVSAAPIEAQISIESYACLWKLMRRGALGFAESYMDGDFDTPDLKALFEFYLANETQLTSTLPRLNLTRSLDRRFHLSRPNTVSGSRRNISDHYDLGNAFYGHWLDESMLYSSALYRSPNDTLEAAQGHKVRRILESLELENGSTLLEIGCGWGELATAAAAAGAKVKGITLSAEQLAAARQRIDAAGLADRAEVAFEDYRDTTGSFDRLVSIEMIEAVGEENWPLYFRTLRDRLNPGGLAVIQAITIKSETFAEYRRNPDFIQRFIFPGGMLPTVEHMKQHSSEAGLTIETIERFGASYASTLAEWRRRFNAAWPEIALLGFDERFRRMWLYYLTYCEIGFERGLIDVGLYVLRRPV